jgi:hypothetical protein
MSDGPAFTVLTFADELLAAPELLGALGLVLAGTPARVAIYAPGADPADLERGLGPLVEASGLEDVVALPVDDDPNTAYALALGVDAVYSRRPAVAAFSQLPHFDDRRAPLLYEHAAEHPDMPAAAAAALRRHQLAPPVEPAFLDLAPYELRACSQNGEDGAIAEIFARIGTTNRFFVEFGIETGVEGNSVFLADHAGWEGLFIEGDPNFYAALSAKYAGHPRIATRHSFVLPGNVEALFDEAGVPPELDLLNIDVDGTDFFIWRALERYRPRVLVIEYNASLDPARKLVQPYAEGRGWDGTNWFGSSVGALRALGEEKGYRLVHTDTAGVNAFFVRADVAGAFPAPDAVVAHPPNYEYTGRAHPADPARRPYLDLDLQEAAA